MPPTAPVPLTVSQPTNATSIVDDATWDLIAGDVRDMAQPGGNPNVTDDQLSHIFLLFAIQCGDNGSSPYVELKASTPPATPGVTGAIKFADIASAIKKYTTLRRFCNLYARPVWNYYIATQVPPACWEKRGFRSSEKYAAFDFFDALFLDPLGVKLLREPNQDEVNAQKINAHMAITNSREQSGNLYSTRAQVTGGRSSASGARYNLPYAVGGLTPP